MASPPPRPGPQPGFGQDKIEFGNFAVLHQQQYRAAFYAAVASGELKPLVLPWSFIGCFLLPVLYLSTPHTTRPWLYRMRWLVAAAVIYLNIRLIQTTSAANEAVAYATGLMAGWGTLWSLRLLIFTRPQWDAARVERRPRSRKTNGNDPSSKPGEKEKSAEITPPDESVAASPSRYEHVWQPFPATAPFLTRLGWAADLFTSFRGAGWNFSIHSIPHPPLPKHLPNSTAHPVSARLDLIPLASRAGASRSCNYASFLRSRLLHITLSWLTIDLLTLLIRQDPYFVYGPSDYSSQHSTLPLPPFLANSPYPQLTTPLFRNLAAGAGIISGLHLYPSLLQLVVVYAMPAAELWQHPTLFGGFVPGVLDRGLAGFWGGWWHQTFRAGFVAPARWALCLLHPSHRHHHHQQRHGQQQLQRDHDGDNDKEKQASGKRAPAAAAVEMLLAFLMSGLLHAAGGFTGVATRGSSSATRCWTPVAFFLLQAVGVLLQVAGIALLQRLAPGALSTLPRWLRRAGNFVFVALWLHFTCWGLIDDMSRAGLWMFEPVPVSPLRMMGFGAPGESWWRWDEEYGLRWYRGRHWWESGIRL